MTPPTTAKPKQPKTLRIGTFNMLRDRPDKAARGNVLAVLNDHNLHALATQEARDYEDVLGNIPGYRYFTRLNPRGANQNGWLVRDDIAASHHRSLALGGDGWTTVGGQHHVGSVAMAITLAGWLRAVSLHLPPSIDWKGGKPVGPNERVDDYIANIKTLERYAKARELGRCKVTECKQHDRYGSDHRFVSFKIQAPSNGKRGLLYLGDWNNRPARDKGYASPQWLAERTGMRVHQVENGGGRGMWGIDYPVAS